MRYKPKAFPLHIPLCGSDHIRQFAGLPYPAVQSFSAVNSGAKGAAEQVSDPKSITLEAQAAAVLLGVYRSEPDRARCRI